MPNMVMPRAAPKVGERLFKAAEVRAFDQEARTVDFIASDESVDRYGDIIRVEGWDLRAYKKNPVLLFGHDSSSPPIGTSAASVEGKQLIARAQFAPEGVYDFADTIFRLVMAKILRAVSVGFLPTAEPNVIRDDKNDRITGFEFIGQELLELSVVPVPANPQALAFAKSLRMSPESMKRMFMQESASAFLQDRQREVDQRLVRVSAKHFVK